MNRIGWIITAALLVAPLSARADVAPPADYVEQCTRGKQQQAGEHCAVHSAWHQDSWGCGTDKQNLPQSEECKSRGSQKECCKAWLAAGWKYRCKTRGASSFSVIWCRPMKPGDPPPPVFKEKKDKGCSVSSTSVGSVGSGILLLGLLLILRRR